jgi:hypothetical protein
MRNRQFACSIFGGSLVFSPFIRMGGFGLSANRTEMGTDTRLALLEGDMEKLLGNGKPGLIELLSKDIAIVKEGVLKARWALWGAATAIMVMLALSGSGTISLKALLQYLKP